jgi:CotH kinase protein/Lamin Tail Domain
MKTTLKTAFFWAAALLVPPGAEAQTFTDSNLPIVIINTDVNPQTNRPRDIPDEPKVLGTMQIIARPNGARNFVADQNNPAFLNYDGRIGIELRGSSSQVLPKKPYSLTTYQNNNVNNNVSLLGLPRENDWVLNALAFDPALLRDYLSYDLARQMGQYASRGRYCEVIVNGDYKGLYVLMERLKADSERINIVRLTPTDNTGPSVTGGYIIKADKTTGGDPVAWSMPSYISTSVDYIHDNPNPGEVTAQQRQYIRDYFFALQTALDTRNESLANGWPALIDVPSFVDFMIMAELTSNVDSYQFSTFFHKDRQGKLRAGPIWDYNLTYGNDLFMWNFDRSFTDVWQFDNNDNEGSKFWQDLYANPTFRCYLARRWQQLTRPGQPLDLALISARIDAIVLEISEATAREERRWRTVGNHAAHVSQMKTWLQNRLAWLSARLNNAQACANPSVPNLVITKIHYHPRAANDQASNDLEFIEITNHSDRAVPLAGVYLQELGVAYQFPANAVARANARLFLASNAAAFERAYGFAPFGQFARNLSNRSQKLVLADAFGNVIDQVEYSDTDPWPSQADGGGPYLSLSSPGADNARPANWAASTESLTSNAAPAPEEVKVYPNPARGVVSLDAGRRTLQWYEVTDLTGRVVKGAALNSFLATVELAGLPESVYVLRLQLADGTWIARRISKM